MILKRFYEEKLAQASYLVGCSSTKEAIVIDANRDVDQYLQEATKEGLRITAVTETHIHADYVSGSRELAERTGGRLFLSGEGDAEWQYAFPERENLVLVKHGDVIDVGKLRLEVLHTPGHTPEHISFLTRDLSVSDKPLCVFTGDFVFVGDVGRPDLLERAANYKGTMEVGARALFESLQKFQTNPDYLMIFPGHGAGSACGKSLGAIPVSTLGYEKYSNWAFSIPESKKFVEMILEGQPEPPKYFAQMKKINKLGPPILGGLRIPPRLPGDRLFEILEKDELLVDIRSAGEAALGFVPGAFNIPLDESFTTWAGWLLDYEKPIYLLANAEEDVSEAVRDLTLIGLDDVRGWLGKDALRAYERRYVALEIVPQITAEQMYQRYQSKEVEILDVRGASEYRMGHIPGARHVPLGYLAEHVAEIPKDKPLVVHCSGGARSSIGISVLRKLGFKNTINLTGGFMEYEAEGLPVEREEKAEIGV
ncbi:MAG TPA: rhodanese-like domain-containing protein [Fimbriimonadales bacterium]|nr:rhodanese-like domain-containing protein [Fimbriimonadales bacterium]